MNFDPEHWWHHMTHPGWVIYGYGAKLKLARTRRIHQGLYWLCSGRPPNSQIFNFWNIPFSAVFGSTSVLSPSCFSSESSIDMVVFTCVLWIVLYQPPTNLWTEEAMDQIKYRRNGWYVASHITYATHVLIVQNILYIRKNERPNPKIWWEEITQPDSTLESTINFKREGIFYSNIFQFHLPVIRLSRRSYPAELANRWDDAVQMPAVFHHFYKQETEHDDPSNHQLYTTIYSLYPSCIPSSLDFCWL